MDGNEDQQFSASETHGHLDPIFTYWQRIAAVAFEGALTHGRGFVVVAITGAEPDVFYRPGNPCDCHQEAVATYNVATQVVVALESDDGADVYCLEGYPSPEQAYKTTTVRVMGAAVH